MDDFDFVAIGGGNTGLAAASRIAKAGRRVALVDPGPLGGLCSLAGCNPKKVLVRATEVLDLVRRASEHGISTGDVEIDWSRVIDRQHRFTDKVPERTEESLVSEGIELVRGTARFLGPDQISVEGRRIRAAGFAIATGSRPRRLSFPGADLVITTDVLLQARTVPSRMVILGAGVVASEFAFVFARLGTKVSIVAPGERALRGFDAEFLAPVMAYAQRLGIDWIWSSTVERVDKHGAALEVAIRSGERARILEADLILNAAGRTAAVEELDLERAGVEVGPAGVVVGAFLRSDGNRRVFAGGDAHGRSQLSPVASYEGRIIARNFLEDDVEEARYDTVPRAVFTTPPLAVVGLTAEEAAARGHDVEVAHHDRSSGTVHAIADHERAAARLVIERQTEAVVGAQLWGESAAELINFFALAVARRVTRSELETMVYAYPTDASAFRYAVR